MKTQVLLRRLSLLTLSLSVHITLNAAADKKPHLLDKHFAMAGTSDGKTFVSTTLTTGEDRNRAFFWQTDADKSGEALIPRDLKRNSVPYGSLPQNPIHLAISPDNLHLALSPEIGEVRTFLLDDYTHCPYLQQPRLSIKIKSGYNGELVFSGQRYLIAAVCKAHSKSKHVISRKAFYIHDVKHGKTHLVPGYTRGGAYYLAARPGSDEFAASHGQFLAVYDASSRTHVRTLESNASPISAIAYSPDGTKLAASSKDGAVRIWEGNTVQPGISFTVNPKESTVNKLAFSPDSTQLAIACHTCHDAEPENSSIYVFNTLTKATAHRFALSQYVRLLAYRSNGDLTAVTRGGTFHLWKNTPTQSLKKEKPHDTRPKVMESIMKLASGLPI